MSLEELKRENEKAEAETVDNPEPAEESGSDSAESIDHDIDSEGSEDIEGENAETVEAWMVSDDQTSQDNETIPLNDLIKVRQKLKGKISDQKDTISNQENELAELKAQVESLKAGASSNNFNNAANKPKREDFLELDDPEEAYIDALSDWKILQKNKVQEQNSKKAEQEKANANVRKQVEGHYQRAAILLDKHKIDAAVYQNADSQFRQAVESGYPGQGDNIADLTLSQIGEGSEKLVMYIGNSTERVNKFRDAWSSDPSGLKVMRLIGGWESEMKEPSKRTSRAPAPAKQIGSNDAGTNMGASYQRRYDKAHKNGNIQEAFNVKGEARKNNIDVSKW